MEAIIRDIIEKEGHFEIHVENEDLTISCHKYKKGKGWEEEVTFGDVTKPRWMIHLEKKYAELEESKKAKKIPLNNFKKFIGKRFKNGKLQD